MNYSSQRIFHFYLYLNAQDLLKIPLSRLATSSLLMHCSYTRVVNLRAPRISRLSVVGFAWIGDRHNRGLGGLTSPRDRQSGAEARPLYEIVSLSIYSFLSLTRFLYRIPSIIVQCAPTDTLGGSYKCILGATGFRFAQDAHFITNDKS